MAIYNIIIINSTFIILKPMKRPQSAKNGGKAAWGQISNQGLSDQENNDNPHRNQRKKLKIMRPDFVTNDFARVLPKKIYQDKERLYSEALQLKQNLNETIEENTRLRTKITILQKEKEKMSRYIQSSQVGMSKAPSRLNVYSKPLQKQNTIVRNLKKMIRENRQQNQFLKQQNAKIKKAIKYTKINELQIQRKMLQDQNQRLNSILQQLNSRVHEDIDNEKKIKELTRYLEQEVENNRELSLTNQNYIQLIDSLQAKLKESETKMAEKQKKLQRDLGLTKRKLNQEVKINDDLRKQLRQLRQQKVNVTQNQPKKQAFKRPTSSHPYTYGKKNQIVVTQQNASMMDLNTKKQIQNLRQKNITLANQLEEMKKQLKQTEQKPQIKKQNQKEIEIKGSEELKGSAQLKLDSQKFDHDQPFIFEDDKNSRKQSQHYQKYQNNYEQQFQQQPTQSKNKQDQIKIHQQEFKKSQQKEESIYKKEVDNKGKKKNKKTAFKPNKKDLSAIKQLLTYRMKAQRYTYSQLKNDIQVSGEVNLHYNDLSKLLKGQPFFLNDQLAQIMLQYIFQDQKPKQDSQTSCQNLINKLRKVIQDYQMADQSQQQLMLLRIAEMTSSYPNQLEAAFENLKNGENTISKNQLTKMFKGLQLAQNYIQLIISELSMCSDDLEHLNYNGFFQRFYLNQTDQAQLQAINHPIDQEQVQSSGGSSRAIGIESNKKKQTLKQPAERIQEVKNEFEDQQDHQFILDKDQKMQQLSMNMNNYDNQDIVSDDGNI